MGVPSVERAFRITEILARRPGITLSDISRKLELAKSSVYYIRSPLKDCGHLERNGINHTLSLGAKLFDVGSIVLDRMEICDMAVPHLEALTAETLLKGPPGAGEAVYEAEVESLGRFQLAHGRDSGCIST
jgi:DNA-binding IclR family transcriptional regulator